MKFASISEKMLGGDRTIEKQYGGGNLGKNTYMERRLDRTLWPK